MSSAIPISLNALRCVWPAPSPEQLPFEPLAGALFAVEIDSPGLPAACFGA